MFLHVEQDANLAWKSFSGFRNLKNPGKNYFAGRMEWVN